MNKKEFERELAELGYVSQGNGNYLLDLTNERINRHESGVDPKVANICRGNW